MILPNETPAAWRRQWAGSPPFTSDHSGQSHVPSPFLSVIGYEENIGCSDTWRLPWSISSTSNDLSMHLSPPKFICKKAVFRWELALPREASPQAETLTCNWWWTGKQWEWELWEQAQEVRQFTQFVFLETKTLCQEFVIKPTEALTPNSIKRWITLLFCNNFSLYGRIYQLFNLLYLMNIRINNCNLCGVPGKRCKLIKEDRFF